MAHHKAGAPLSAPGIVKFMSGEHEASTATPELQLHMGTQEQRIFEITEIFVEEYITCTKPKRKETLKERAKQSILRFEYSIHKTTQQAKTKLVQYERVLESKMRQCTLLLSCGDVIAVEAGSVLIGALLALCLQHTPPAMLFSLARDFTMLCLSNVKPPPLSELDRELAMVALKALVLVSLRIIAVRNCGALDEYEMNDIIHFARCMQSIKQLRNCVPYSASIFALSQLSFIDHAAHSLEIYCAGIASASITPSSSEFFQLVRRLGVCTARSYCSDAWTQLLSNKIFHRTFCHKDSPIEKSCVSSNATDAFLFLHVVAPHLASDSAALLVLMAHFHAFIVDGSLATTLLCIYCDILGTIALEGSCADIRRAVLDPKNKGSLADLIVVQPRFACSGNGDFFDTSRLPSNADIAELAQLVSPSVVSESVATDTDNDRADGHPYLKDLCSVARHAARMALHRVKVAAAHPHQRAYAWLEPAAERILAQDRQRRMSVPADTWQPPTADAAINIALDARVPPCTGLRFANVVRACVGAADKPRPAPSQPRPPTPTLDTPTRLPRPTLRRGHAPTRARRDTAARGTRIVNQRGVVRPGESCTVAAECTSPHGQPRARGRGEGAGPRLPGATGPRGMRGSADTLSTRTCTALMAILTQQVAGTHAPPPPP
eukprot:m.832119 g.832119  ORF g.832119 m.832119 type:complete len:664 (+) comp23433_c1_seq1:264-2255(+)